MSEPMTTPSRRVPAMVPSDSSPEPVQVTVQWRGAPPQGGDRSTRKAALRHELEEVLSGHPGLDVDWSTVSLSGQTVDGQVPPASLDAVVEELKAEGLRVDLVFDRQILEDY